MAIVRHASNVRLIEARSGIIRVFYDPYGTTTHGDAHLPLGSTHHGDFLRADVTELHSPGDGRESGAVEIKIEIAERGGQFRSSFRSVVGFLEIFLCRLFPCL